MCFKKILSAIKSILGFVCELRWFHSVTKKKVCCFYAFSLCRGTPHDPAVAPAEAGHCEGGGVGGRGRRAKKEQSEACKDISVNLPKLVKKMTGA